MNLDDFPEAAYTFDRTALKCARCDRKIGQLGSAFDYRWDDATREERGPVGVNVSLEPAWIMVEGTKRQVWRVSPRARRQELYLARNPHARRAPDETARQRPETLAEARGSRTGEFHYIGVPNIVPSELHDDEFHNVYLMICDCGLKQKIVVHTLGGFDLLRGSTPVVESP